jgi:RES domain-containing protein
VERADSAVISMLSTPLLRERRAHFTNGSQRNQWFSYDLALLCHERGARRGARSGAIFSGRRQRTREGGWCIPRKSAPSHQGLGSKLILPCVLCSYEVDCEDIVDLGTKADCAVQAIDPTDMECDWRSYVASGCEPPSWHLARRLISDGYAGILVPSFAPGATSVDQNLVLWKWGNQPPHQVNVFDPKGRLPRNQLSWD